MECPFIDRDTEPNPDFNTLVNYRDFGGVDYIFYDHDDDYGNITRVQFCQLCGRKRDVFECLNKSEWKRCSHFLTNKEKV